VFQSGAFQSNAFQIGGGVGSTPAAVVTTFAGAPGRLLRRFSAEINGKFYYFDSMAELQTVLNSFKAKQKRKINKRVSKTAIPVTIPQIEVPVHVPMWAAQEIQKVNASLEAYYWQQYQLLMDQDEEDSIVALFG
jgi:YHS domain-containing protein